MVVAGVGTVGLLQVLKASEVSFPRKCTGLLSWLAFGFGNLLRLSWGFALHLRHICLSLRLIVMYLLIGLLARMRGESPIIITGVGDSSDLWLPAICLGTFDLAGSPKVVELFVDLCFTEGSGLSKVDIVPIGHIDKSISKISNRSLSFGHFVLVSLKLNIGIHNHC